MGVVIPVYNTRKLCLEAARSARAALGRANNIVIVDDGSTERATLESLAILESEGFRVVRQSNRGVSAARNAGLALMDVPYAFVLDSDDLLGIAAPAVAAAVLDESRDVVIVAGSGIEFTSDGDRSEPIPPGRPTRDSMRDGSLIATASAFRVADWRNSGGFPEGLRMGEEWVFWMRLLRDGGSIAVADAIFVQRRLHAGQVTRGYADPRQAAWARNLVLNENPDLFLQHHDEVISELARVRALLAEYRHAYRHLDRLKSAVRGVVRPRRGSELPNTDDATPRPGLRQPRRQERWIPADASATGETSRVPGRRVTQTRRPRSSPVLRDLFEGRRRRCSRGEASP